MKKNCCKSLLALVICTLLGLCVPGRALADTYYNITRLTDTTYNENIPVISDNGSVVWSGGSSYHEEEIFLYNGSTSIQLTNNEYIDHSPEINPYGKVVWWGWDGQDEEIFLYDGTSVTQITDNSSHDFTPQINSASHVAWRSQDQTARVNENETPC